MPRRGSSAIAGAGAAAAGAAASRRSSGDSGRRYARSTSPSASMVVSSISPATGALISRTPVSARVQRDNIRSPRRHDQTLYTLS